SPRFLEDNQPCSGVPRVKIHFPESVATAKCDVAKIQSRRTTPPHRLTVKQKCLELAHRRFHFLPHTVGKTRQNQSPAQLINFGNLQTAAVYKRAQAARPAEHLIPARIVYRATQHLAVM